MKLICALKNIDKPHEENQTLSQRENECTPSVDNDNVETDDFELFLKSRSGSEIITTIVVQQNIKILICLQLWKNLMMFKGSLMILILEITGD